MSRKPLLIDLHNSKVHRQSLFASLVYEMIDHIDNWNYPDHKHA